MKRSDHKIVQQVLDGAVSKETFDGFQERMRNEPDLVKFYGDYANLHHNLLEEYEDQPVSIRPAVISRNRTSGSLVWLAAAAVVALLAVIYFKRSPGVVNAPALAADVRFSQDAVWRVDGVSRGMGDKLGLGKGATLVLEQGQAEVLSADASSALVDGPASLTLVGDGMLHLSAGRARFRLGKEGGKLEVSTPSMSATDLGTEFGIEVHPDQPDELHVFEGRVSMRVNGNADGEVLAAGEAGRIRGSNGIERFASEESRFIRSLRDFRSLVEGRFVKGDWRVDYGNPSVSEDRIEGENYSVFLKLPEAEPADGNSVLLVTLNVSRPPNGNFHTDGWAGMSFFSQGNELLFFGDSFGPEITWSLDVKQRIPVILPANPVVGPRAVTLRYERKTGEVSLHEGGLPLGPAFCNGKLPAGSSFDEIRLGASSSAALAVDGLTIRTGGTGNP